MAQYSNAQILSAVLVKWGQPLIESFTSSKLMKLPFLANIENKIKSTGWVSPMWSLGKDLAPMLGNVTNSMIEPIIINYLKDVPDDMLPTMAHNIVENGIRNGGLSLFEDNIIIEVEDLQELQTLLRYNLPIKTTETYTVLTSEPQEHNE